MTELILNMILRKTEVTDSIDFVFFPRVELNRVGIHRVFRKYSSTCDVDSTDRNRNFIMDFVNVECRAEDFHK